MKRNYFVLVFVLFFSLAIVTSVFAGPPKGLKAAQHKAVLSTSLARISFETTEHDFGPLATGTTHNCEFKFTNTGSGVLKITNISASCGCTIVELTKKEYQSGEESTMR